MILAGDIGGTKTNLSYFDVMNRQLVQKQMMSYPSHEYPSLSAIVARFRREYPAQISAAAFGIAGPVINGHSVLTNVGWELDVETLRKDLALDAVELINDLQATAYGTLRLSESEQFRLQNGQAQVNGAIAVIAAGTGLGEGGMIWDGKNYRAIASEGGHADFSPRNDLECSLMQFLAGKFGHVSWERILSGPGLFSLYEFLSQRSSTAAPAWLKADIASGDPAAAVSKAAMEGKDTTCVEALDLFVSLYGSETGNLALKLLSTGGVFIGGGIAPKILPKLKTPLFLRNFIAKGRLESTLQKMPVSVVLNDKIAMVGAAHVASLLAEA